jgi:RecB family endonuclease NucS
MRVVIARCAARYSGRLNAHLPAATRAIMVKADGSVLLHSDGGSYKPLNWMSPPCTLRVEVVESEVDADTDGEVFPVARWIVQHDKTDDRLEIEVFEIFADTEYALGSDPGLIKDGVEAHLQELLAEQVALLGAGHTLVRREFPTAIGPVDILARDATGRAVAVEIKRRGDIDGVEQLTRYLELLNRDPLLSPVVGVYAAQDIKPQARVLAQDRGIRCLVLDYEAMRGVDQAHTRLF